MVEEQTSVPDLPALIRQYESAAGKLEGARKDIAGRLEHVVDNELIPKILPLLPEDYTVSRRYAEMAVLTHGSEPWMVPAKFSVELQLLHKGEQISGNADETGREIHVRTQHVLQEFVIKYSLERISIKAGHATIVSPPFDGRVGVVEYAQID